ncbi:6,7-dimethyl-8-ribityllumazine synthase [bacterium]|nr:6,7-dimethyl-8-ribityllumazine synthase [bacterium]NCQ55120.1 6,7-dimethyl-8-ribityllumazine synthase [Candidatus Parcubacteria bacterium]NCS67367.1 6,7-dimethyl-8-ribityllumazine synthase [Candidatus Peregrinibacteria bacterium]NCS96622.1 6,7-dimethyl-8-ribityllumazine synthase [bacterium]
MILIVAAQFDKSGNDVIEGLIASAIIVLESHKMSYKLVRVPGAVEIPIAVQRCVYADPKIDAVIALGCVIKGESDHYELVTQSVTQGLTALALKLDLPVVQGVLACHNAGQATDRISLGDEFAQTALALLETLPPRTR